VAPHLQSYYKTDLALDCHPWPLAESSPTHSIIMNQYVYVSLSLIGLCGIVGAGVAIGSG